MVENLTQRVGNETDKSKSNFRKYLAGGLVVGVLSFSAGYGISKYNSYGVESKVNDKKAPIRVSEYNSYGVESKLNGENKVNDKKAPIKNSLEVVSDNVASHKNLEKDDKEISNKSLEEMTERDWKELERKAEKFAESITYIYNEDSKFEELRMKVDDLNEGEKAKLISMKGTIYNKKEGYISFSEEFEEYNSVKDIAILCKYSKIDRDNISDKERKFIKKNAPDAYRILFLFDTKYDDTKVEEKKRSEIKEKTDKNPTASKIGEFLGGLIVWGLETRVRAEVERAFGNTEIITTKDGKIYSRKDLDKDLDEDIEPPKPLPLK